MANGPRNGTRPSHLQMQPIKTHPDPEPTFAFGFVLDHQCRLRWANYFLEEYQKSNPGKFTSPPEREKMIRGLLVAICSALPERVYSALPALPRIRSRLLPIQDNELVFSRFVFAMRDNSTARNLHSPLTAEHIDVVRKELGLPGDQQPQWVPSPMYVHRGFCTVAASPLISASCNLPAFDPAARFFTLLAVRAED